jgi:hypothetical protein
MTADAFPVKARAPELRATRWVNSDPLTWQTLSGKAVLLDFMTYSCVNCVRTFPHMRCLWTNFKDGGLVIIASKRPSSPSRRTSPTSRTQCGAAGSSAPSWSTTTTKAGTSSATAIGRYNDSATRTGPCGTLAPERGGEEEIEERVLRLLREAGQEARLPPGPHREESHGRFITAETHCGFVRNTGMGNPAQHCTDSGCTYVDEDEKHLSGVIYLDGTWKQQEQYLEYTGAERGHLLLRFKAAETNLVITAPARTEIDVLLDGTPIPKEAVGRDVVVVNGRRSCASISVTDISCSRPTTHPITSLGWSSRMLASGPAPSPSADGKAYS